MKIRTGFVSNSSSSSFVCEVCGEEYSGFDAGLLEAEMSECERGHVFCDSHMSPESKILSDEEKKAFIIEAFGLEGDEAVKASQLDSEVLDAQYEEALEEADDRYSVDKSRCPLCTFHRPNDKQLVKYFMYVFSKSRDGLMKDMKTMFNDNEELEEGLKTKGLK